MTGEPKLAGFHSGDLMPIPQTGREIRLTTLSACAG
jgi:hypothetical protein